MGRRTLYRDFRRPVIIFVADRADRGDLAQRHGPEVGILAGKQLKAYREVNVRV